MSLVGFSLNSFLLPPFWNLLLMPVVSYTLLVLDYVCPLVPYEHVRTYSSRLQVVFPLTPCPHWEETGTGRV